MHRVEEALSGSWWFVCTVAFTLGLRHGLDADHLATIDGLARRNARDNPRLAQFSGTLFSLGHGIVILVIAVVASILAGVWETPAWLEISGTAISISFLLGLAFLNLYSVWTTPAGQVVRPAGIRSRLFGRIVNVEHPLVIVAVGMLFALSFDTVTHAALFAIAAESFGGVGPSLMLASLFVLGMLIADGANGFWIAHLIRRADRKAVIASRLMATAVGLLSLGVGAFTILKLVSPALDHAAEQAGIWVGIGVLGLIALAFLLAMFAATGHGHAEAHKMPAE
jgi:high-affinity nickel-transport protein